MCKSPETLSEREDTVYDCLDFTGWDQSSSCLLHMKQIFSWRLFRDTSVPDICKDSTLSDPFTRRLQLWVSVSKPLYLKSIDFSPLQQIKVSKNAFFCFSYYSIFPGTLQCVSLACGEFIPENSSFIRHCNLAGNWFGARFLSEWSRVCVCVCVLYSLHPTARTDGVIEPSSMTFIGDGKPAAHLKAECIN